VKRSRWNVVFSLLLTGLCGARVANSASFSFTGLFFQDDNVRLYAFTLSSPGSVTLETWSYGGGTDAAGQMVPGGGFDTDLTLFSSSGSLVDLTFAGSGCPPGHTDLATGLCGDSLLSQSLGAGKYIVALTEYPNTANGTTLSSGFLEDGQGNFTGPAICGTAGSFLDLGCNQRNANFELDIVGAASATLVPEPASVVLFGFGLLVISTTIIRRYYKVKTLI
jgi:hypothetical protein